MDTRPLGTSPLSRCDEHAELPYPWTSTGLVLEQLGTGLHHPVGAHLCLVGRADDVDVHLADAQVSSRHVLLSCDGDHWFVQDLHSSTGTRLNGVRLHDRAPLAVGDVLTLGSTILRLEAA